MIPFDKRGFFIFYFKKKAASFIKKKVKLA